MKWVIPITLLAAIPIEALNFRMLSVCSIVDGCGNANPIEVAFADISMLSHMPALLVALKSSLTSIPISGSAATLLLVLNGYAVTVLLILVGIELLRLARRVLPRKRNLAA
ncbi:MAG: hypothetical protein WB117_02370 [Candidatus Acidiferrales bacterium]